MNISIQPQIKNTTFRGTVNPFASNLKFKREDFFINIMGYGKNKQWADKVISIADDTTKDIYNNLPFLTVLQNIAEGAKLANSLTLDLNKRLHTGILRGFCKNWGKEYGEWKGYGLLTEYDFNKSKYKCYAKRLEETRQNPLEKPFPEIGLTRPYSLENKNYLIHADSKFLEAGLKKAEEIFNSMQKKFRDNATNNNIDEVNNGIATIRWIMAHTTPFERGSDLIANILMRSMYKSFGIKTYPSKKGISFDLESFCTPLKEYKKHFKDYFEKAPTILN